MIALTGPGPVLDASLSVWGFNDDGGCGGCQRADDDHQKEGQPYRRACPIGHVGGLRGGASD